jgi:hypothetical protein
MLEYYFSLRLDGDKLLCLAPLTERRLAASGQSVSDRGGYFLYEQHGEGDEAEVEILAQALSDEAALRLRDLFRMT